jgi:ribonuclease HI
VSPAKRYEAWFDGACEPINPGGKGVAAFVIADEAGLLVAEQAIDLGRCPGMTNNIAEYRGLTGLLEKVIVLRKASIERGDHAESVEILVRGDSLLVVSQVDGSWNCNKDHLIRLRDDARRLLGALRKLGVEVRLAWIPREENTRADALTKSLYSESELGNAKRREREREQRKNG